MCDPDPPRHGRCHAFYVLRDAQCERITAPWAICAP
jgi:hypothetical protein